MQFNKIALSKLKKLSGKHRNNKIAYYAKNYCREYTPSVIFRSRLNKKLATISKFDPEYIEYRVNYYNRLNDQKDIEVDATRISDLKLGKRGKVYYFDAMEYLNYFDKKLKGHFLFGDITYVPEVRSITKSRPIHGDNANSVIMKLEKVRHFNFLKDSKSFESKKNMMIGRSVAHQQHRMKFLNMYINHPMCNIGQINTDMNPQFIRERLTISEHLDYKFILCLEGWDVATNLKWVMSSNSLAVMPKPTYETWYMEGTLIPNFHYVEIKSDYSDLEERLNYYIEHTDEALQIIKNAQQYTQQFKNKEQEDLISLLVLKKYFEKTGQQI
jgi:hypothetical protein